MVDDTSTALLLMDFQRGIVDGVGAADAVGRARDAADAARAAGVPVVFVRVAFRDGAPEVASGHRTFGARSSLPGEGDAGAQVVEALGRRPDEPLVTKRRISAFTGSDLAVLLRALGAQRLVLVGVSTSGVALSTLRQAADLDFDLVVLADACADRDPEVHRVLLGKVFPRQAEVITTAQWASSLAAASP